MNELTYMDLPTFLYNMEGGADLTLVGLLTGYIEPPSSLSKLSYKKGTKLGKLELIGVKVHIYATDDVEDVMEYRCKGIVPILVNEYIQEQYNKKQSGKLALTLRGNINLARGNKKNIKLNGVDDNLVVGFKRYLNNHNIWCASPFKTYLLSKELEPKYFDLLLKASKNNWLLHEDSTKLNKDYVCAGEGIDFNSLMVGGFTPSPSIVEEAKEIDKSLIDVSKFRMGNLGVVEDEANNNLSNIVVSEDDISILLKNRTREVSKITNRVSVVPKSGGIKDLSSLIDNSSKKVAKYIDDIKDIPKSEWSDALEYMAIGLSQLWSSIGKTLFVGTLVKLFPKEESKITIIEAILGVDFPKKWALGEVIEGYEMFCALLNNAKELIYINILDTVLMLKGRLVNMYYVCSELDICILSLMHRNPYYLGLIGTSLNIEDLDLLALIYNIKNTSDIVKLRNAVIGHLYMLNNNNKGIGGNTLIKQGYLYYNLQGGKILNKQMYDLVVATGRLLTEDQINAIKRLFAPTLNELLLDDSEKGYIETYKDGVKKYIKATESSANVLEDYISSGLGIKVVQDGIAYVCNYVLAEMEMYIYSKLHSLASKKISPLNIDTNKLLYDFECSKSLELGMNFKLEDKQKDVINLASAHCGCLTGCAGSGKTTTAELLLYALEKGYKYKKDDIVFVAPTGRASSRLREVVKRKATTIHSYFGIKSENYGIFNRFKDYELVDARVVVSDEMSMANIHLMYNMLKRIGDTTRLYLIGDKEQLTPIGFGKPFVNALYYLPTLILEVNKRASKTSGIALNSSYMLNTTESYKDLVSTDDFKLIDVNTNDIEATILDICRYHVGLEANINDYDTISKLSNLSIDDIQIVTPLNKGIWGTRNLNKRLQNLFNTRAKVSVTVRKGTDSEVVFKLGDKVIHTENHNDRIRLESLGNGIYKKLKDDLQHGVMNGDVGKVVDIKYGKDLNFIGDNKLKEEFRGTDYTYYLIVEYMDIDSETLEPIKYYILYGFESGTHTNHMEAKIKGNGLGVLDLAYALTVHKLQGSQANLVIFALDKVARKGFISRNMLYTGISRSKKGCYLVGNVQRPNSVIDEGRRIEQCKYILTTLDKIV